MLLQVARLYYERDMTQQEIAGRLNITRQKVSRLLLAARADGIVQITINDPTPGNPGLVNKLCKAFNLDHAVLVSGSSLDAETLRTSIGLAAADYLYETLQDGEMIGIGWGRTLSEVIGSLRSDRTVSIHVVPMVGGVGEMAPSFQVNEITRHLAKAFGGTYRYLYAPVFTQNLETWKAIMETSEVQQVASQWPLLDRALVGVGHVRFQQISSMFFGDYISSDALAQLEAKGAVGDICGRFFDQDGQPVSLDIGVIGVGLEQLCRIKNVTAVAGGPEKVPALLGALRGGYIKILVTDTSTANALIDQA